MFCVKVFIVCKSQFKFDFGQKFLCKQELVSYLRNKPDPDFTGLFSKWPLPSDVIDYGKWHHKHGNLKDQITNKIIFFRLFTNKSARARLTRKRFESFLRVLSVLTARHTRKLPRTDVRTSRTRRRVSSQDNTSSILTQSVIKFQIRFRARESHIGYQRTN